MCEILMSSLALQLILTVFTYYLYLIKYLLENFKSFLLNIHIVYEVYNAISKGMNSCQITNAFCSIYMQIDMFIKHLLISMNSNIHSIHTHMCIYLIYNSFYFHISGYYFNIYILTLYRLKKAFSFARSISSFP